MKFAWKPLVVVYVFAALLVTIFIVSVKFQLPFVFRPPQIRQVANLDAYNADSLKDGAISSVALDLLLQVLSPSISDPERKFELVPYGNIDTYVRDDNQELDVKQVCVDSISLVVNTEINPHQFLKEPLCHAYTEDDWFGDYSYDLGNGSKYNLTNHWYYEFPHQDMVPFVADHPNVIGVNFWFPYDGFVLNVYVQAQTTITLSDGSTKTETVPISYDWKLQTSSSRPWDVTMQNDILQLTTESQVSESISTNFQPGYYEWTQLTLRRQSLYFFAFPILLIAMIIFISLMTQLTNSGIDGIIGVQTGLLFATFALRSILSPGREIGQTLIEVSVIGLNILQIFAAIVLFIRIIRKNRREGRQANQDTGNVS
jgi:hypothetical protein